MQGTKGSAAGDYSSLMTGFASDKRNDFVEDILIELLMPDRLMPGIHMIIQPAFHVDAVDGKDLYFSVVDIRLYAIDQLKSFILEKIGRSCRHKQQGEAIVAVHCNRHVFAKGRTVPSC